MAHIKNNPELFWTIHEHLGHTIKCAYYGDKNNPQNTAIECVTCGCNIVNVHAEPANIEKTAAKPESEATA